MKSSDRPWDWAEPFIFVLPDGAVLFQPELRVTSETKPRPGALKEAATFLGAGYEVTLPQGTLVYPLSEDALAKSKTLKLLMLRLGVSPSHLKVKPPRGAKVCLQARKPPVSEFPEDFTLLEEVCDCQDQEALEPDESAWLGTHPGIDRILSRLKAIRRVWRVSTADSILGEWKRTAQDFEDLLFPSEIQELAFPSEEDFGLGAACSHNWERRKAFEVFGLVTCLKCGDSMFESDLPVDPPDGA